MLGSRCLKREPAAALLGVAGRAPSPDSLTRASGGWTGVRRGNGGGGSSGQYRKGSLRVGHRGTWPQEREGLGPGLPGVSETPSLTCCAHVAKCLNFSELPCPNSERGASSIVVRGGEFLGKAQGTWPYLLTSE